MHHLSFGVSVARLKEGTKLVLLAELAVERLLS
ncbi:hypothetical protein Patl1_20288 [Pistacia atlantica]|uniref:Uncharacterized protein n=1 Tax=Pistacia atlantica TaxID=434234 RepID=A0ACC1BI95_9ROSI|nr:hypothetical protein Patl1_20288 [Pistacia atlantica]